MPTASRAGLIAACRERLAAGSKSFAKATELFAPETRDSVTLLYAWCRHCDDVVDDQVLGFRPAEQQGPSPGELDQRVRALRAATLAACDIAGPEPDDVPFRALRDVVARHGVPVTYALDLIDGFAMDAEGRHYASLEDTLVYCYHVAGAVGVMMAYVMGVRETATLRRAGDLGIAFQLTNIARDVMADAAAGRLYLPADWLAEAGVEARPVAVLVPGHKAGVFTVTARLLDVADRYYDSAAYGLSALPVRSALAIAAARRIYRAIGAKVRAAGAGAWEQRAMTTRREKLSHMALAAGDAVSAASLGRLSTAPARAGLWTPAPLRAE
ncbi:MAG: phytoene/squalene synthase family protein [Hyphomicrobiaceae bacterium]|nr:phytoene/squalene synthase family protein [Hyphomicrobiaceae bacterium]